MQTTAHQSVLTSNGTLPPYDHSYVYHFASEYRDRGWPVIPLQHKRPAIARWKPYQDRLPTADEIDSWFCGDRPAHTNLGIVTGNLSGLIVVDCDSDDSTQYWLDHYPASPMMVRTAGGGLHIYYRAPEGALIGNRTGVGGRKIDLRGQGGYVVAPPSRGENGNLYAWTSWGDYSHENVPTLDPKWIAGLESPPPTMPQSCNVKHGAAYIRHIRAVSGKNGHNATFRAACKLRDARMSPEEALTELIIWNETNAEPPWTARELLHKVQSAYAQPRPR